MNSIKEIKVSFKTGIDYIAACFGNPNILRNHIAYFEKKAIEEIANFKNIPDPSWSELPNYCVWLRLNVEYLINKMVIDFTRMDGKEISTTIRKKFKNILKHLKEHIDSLPVKEREENQLLFKDLLVVMELGHCFRHGGLPNPVREIKTHKELGIDIDFEKIVIDSINPSNFPKTKMIFSNAANLLESLPKPTITF